MNNDFNKWLRERRAVNPEMALQLSRLFGNTAEFWLDAQRAVDLWEAVRTMRGIIERISPLKAAYSFGLLAGLRAGDVEIRRNDGLAENNQEKSHKD